MLCPYSSPSALFTQVDLLPNLEPAPFPEAGGAPPPPEHTVTLTVTLTATRF